MRKSYKFAKKQKNIVKHFKYNQAIKAPVLRVIDLAGNVVGEIPTAQALELAKEHDTDLVEVSPKANPPVAKLMDYGKFHYQQEKQIKQQKKSIKKVDTKGIRISAKISEHDMETKMKQATKFLDHGHKVKIELILRGREHQHTDKAKDQIKNFIEHLDFPHIVEQDISKQGSKIFTIIAPEKNN